MASERDCVEHLLQVAGNRRLALQEVIALGFLVSRKWDRAKEANRQSGTSVSNIEALRFDNYQRGTRGVPSRSDPGADRIRRHRAIAAGEK